MSSWSKLWLTLLLVVSMTPGWGELLENLEHLAHDGHLAHFSAHAERDAGAEDQHAAADEHGCTPLSHSCPCHVSTPAILVDPQIAARLPVGVAERAQHPWRGAYTSSWAIGPPVPPPKG